MRAVLLVTLLVLAACGSPEPAPPPRATPVTTATPSRAWTAVDEDLGAHLGAMSTMFTYCVPGLPGDRACDWGRISAGLTEVTAKLRDAVAAGPGPDGHGDLLAATDAMDRAVTAFAPCTAWFDASGATGDTAACDPLWYALGDAWSALKEAADWPR